MHRLGHRALVIFGVMLVGLAAVVLLAIRAAAMDRGFSPPLLTGLVAQQAAPALELTSARSLALILLRLALEYPTSDQFWTALVHSAECCVAQVQSVVSPMWV